MSEFLELTEDLKTAVGQLNQVLQGDENTTVMIDGEEKPSVQKKTLDTVNAQVQLVLDAAADIDAVKYANTAAGIAATTNGQFFSVVSNNNERYLDLYKNESDVAVYKKSYPSTNFIWPRGSLSPYFMFHGSIDGTTNLNTLREDGVHYGVSTPDMEGLPKGFSGSFAVYVNEVFNGTGSFTHQVLKSFANPLIQWTRQLSGSGETDWEPLYQNPYMWSKGVLDNNSSTQDATDDGLYFLASGNNYGDMPEGTGGKDYMLEVNEAFYTNKGRFKNQSLWESSNPSKKWIRRVDLSGPPIQSWGKSAGNSKSVTRDMLTQSFDGLPTITSGSIDNETDTGTSIVTNAVNVSGLPKGVGSGILDVRQGENSSWGYQEITSLADAGVKHRRIIRPGHAPSEFEGMPASGKTIACFGDSLTENGTYPQQLSALLGCETLRMGFGGCRMGNHEDSGYNAMSMCNMSEDIANNDFTRLIAGAIDVRDRTGDDNTQQAQLVRDTDWDGVDYVIIFFGTNDYGAHVPIGTKNDNTGSTFHGAINKTVTNLLGAYPHLKVMFITGQEHEKRL